MASNTTTTIFANKRESKHGALSWKNKTTSNKGDTAWYSDEENSSNYGKSTGIQADTTIEVSEETRDPNQIHSRARDYSRRSDDSEYDPFDSGDRLNGNFVTSVLDSGTRGDEEWTMRSSSTRTREQEEINDEIPMRPVRAKTQDRSRY